MQIVTTMTISLINDDGEIELEEHMDHDVIEIESKNEYLEYIIRIRDAT